GDPANQVAARFGSFAPQPSLDRPVLPSKAFHAHRSPDTVLTLGLPRAEWVSYPWSSRITGSREFRAVARASAWVRAVPSLVSARPTHGSQLCGSFAIALA